MIIIWIVLYFLKQSVKCQLMLVLNFIWYNCPCWESHIGCDMAWKSIYKLKVSIYKLKVTLQAGFVKMSWAQIRIPNITVLSAWFTSGILLLFRYNGQNFSNSHWKQINANVHIVLSNFKNLSWTSSQSWTWSGES